MEKIKIPKDKVDFVEENGVTYYSLLDLFNWFEMSMQGLPLLERYNLRLIYVMGTKRGRKFVHEDDVINIVLRHRKLVERFIMKK